MKTELFNFYIPEQLIAQFPSQKRSDSRLLVYDRKNDKITDSHTKYISNFLSHNDFLVFNNSKVIPARIPVIREKTGKKGEVLILKIIDHKTAEILTDKSKKYPVGSKIIFPENKTAVVEKELEDSTKLLISEDKIFELNYLDKNGLVPLPPYIRNKKTVNDDKNRYQTIYSKIPGSSAAPTAGLHFDDNIFNSFKKKNINHAFVSLHVGLGTFQPIYTDEIEKHNIHKEEYFIDNKEAEKINNALKQNKRIIPVGTTSLRTLETAISNNKIPTGPGESKLYIYPPYKFKITGALITNFHTPKSSLLVLVSALIGRKKVLEIYDYAITKEYRFFSYGDAMLIL